ncbi:DMT family transporter [Agrococcus sp. HG114]|uniref:DMT family transporter n=1 Tax=Agrococcus sp. HG114 TaxID=2969757 RepID=UPI00215AD04B|nr:DMT family transporter [Agrococcus sp. HG114]MCR8671299.1 DMT family transporter [Agrococcus sp. HG114]
MTAAAVDAPPRGLARAPWQVLWISLAVIWGSSFLLMKLGLEALHPMQIATLRIAVAAVTLVLLAAAMRVQLPRDARTWGLLAVCSLFLTALPFTAFVVAETRISSSLAGLGNAATPIATVLFALLLLPSDRLTPRKLAAVLLGLVGVVLIAQPWTSEAGPDLVGFLIAVGGAASYGVGWTLNRRLLAHREVPGLAQPTALMVTGLPMVLLALLLWSSIEGWSPLGSHDPGALPLALLATAALGVVGTGLAYVLQFEVVRAVGPTVAATVTYLIPVVAVGLGVLVLGERLGVWEVVGAAVVIGAGILVGQRPKARVAAV